MNTQNATKIAESFVENHYNDMDVSYRGTPLCHGLKLHAWKCISPNIEYEGGKWRVLFEYNVKHFSYKEWVGHDDLGGYGDLVFAIDVSENGQVSLSHICTFDKHNFIGKKEVPLFS